MLIRVKNKYVYYRGVIFKKELTLALLKPVR